MRLLAALIALLPMAHLDAAPLRVRPAEELQLVFLDGDERAPVRRAAYGDATLDVGSVRAQRCGARGCASTIIKRRFRLRVDGRGSRFVRVRAFLQDDTPGQRVRIDGRLLTSAPQLVGAAIPLRVAVSHTLEIEIPTSEPDGMLTRTIVWLVEDTQ